jgi:hypothetical protein
MAKSLDLTSHMVWQLQSQYHGGAKVLTFHTDHIHEREHSALS